MYLLKSAESFGISAENPTGKRNGGTRGKDCDKLNPNVHIKSGETVTICDFDGPAVIKHIWLTGDITHSLILRIFWENSEFPSVEAPISAFFGCGYDENFGDIEGKYPFINSSLMMLAPGRGCNCYFEMPFKKHCRITVENRGENAHTLYYMITGQKEELPENISYFHAVYRQEHPVQKGKSYTVLDNITGRGRFIGLTLYVGVNGHNTCWVEGEAKMYIDGEEYPSLNYTGTEDYFCGSYAFGNDIGLKKYQTYSGLYAGLYAILGDTTEMYNAQKRFLLYRWHEKDAIYFSNSFKMVMDNLGWTGPRYDDYTTTAYYYLERPAKLPFELPKDNEIIMK